MDFEIENKELQKLYTKGKSIKYPVSDSVLKKFYMRLCQIKASHIMSDIENCEILRYTKINGKESKFSVNVTEGYLLLLKVEEVDNTNMKFTVVDLVHK